MVETAEKTCKRCGKEVQNSQNTCDCGKIYSQDFIHCFHCKNNYPLLDKKRKEIISINCERCGKPFGTKPSLLPVKVKPNPILSFFNKLIATFQRKWEDIMIRLSHIPCSIINFIKDIIFVDMPQFELKDITEETPEPAEKENILILKSSMIYDEYWYVINIINVGNEKSFGRDSQDLLETTLKLSKDGHSSGTVYEDRPAMVKVGEEFMNEHAIVHNEQIKTAKDIVVSQGGIEPSNIGIITKEDRRPGEEAIVTRTLNIKKDDLYREIEKLMNKHNLPVKSEIRKTRWEIPFEQFGERFSCYIPEKWLKQLEHMEEMFVVNLKEHIYSSIKFVIAMHELGNFVEIQTLLIEEPDEEKIPEPRKYMVKFDSSSLNKGYSLMGLGTAGIPLSIIIGFVLIFVFSIKFYSPLGIVFSVILMLSGIIASVILTSIGGMRNSNINSAYERKRREVESQYQREKKEYEDFKRERKKVNLKLKAIRGFKDDDRRILCHSIQKIVDIVIKDLFLKQGAKIEKSGFEGKGDFSQLESAIEKIDRDKNFKANIGMAGT